MTQTLNKKHLKYMLARYSKFNKMYHFRHRFSFAIIKNDFFFMSFSEVIPIHFDIIKYTNTLKK